MAAYGATADETNPFSKAEMGEAQDLKPVLAPVFVQPLRSRAKRRRRSGGLLLAAVLAVVVTASQLAQHHPHAALARVGQRDRHVRVHRQPVRPVLRRLVLLLHLQKLQFQQKVVRVPLGIPYGGLSPEIANCLHQL